MLTTADLLRAAKAAQHFSSNSKLARALDAPEKTVQRWNTGRTTPDDTYALRLAELAGLDAGEVLVSMAAERADGPTRTLWEGIARRMQNAGLASALSVILSAGFFGGGGDAQAATSALRVVDAPQSVYYVNRLLALIGRIRRFWQTPGFSMDRRRSFA